MRLSKQEAEAVEYLREWVTAGFPKRADGSFPTDFLAAFRLVAQVPDEVKGRTYEEALIAGPDFDYASEHHTGWKAMRHYRENVRRVMKLDE